MCQQNQKFFKKDQKTKYQEKKKGCGKVEDLLQQVKQEPYQIGTGFNQILY